MGYKSKVEHNRQKRRIEYKYYEENFDEKTG